MTSCRRSIAPSTYCNWPGFVARSFRGIFVRVSKRNRGSAMPPECEADASQPRRPYWLWPLRPSPRLGSDLLRLATLAEPLLNRWWWPVLALGIGTGPLLLGYLLGTSLHHLLTAVLVAPLLWASLCTDRQVRGLALVAVVMVSHSALAIFLAAHDPERAGVVFPESDHYWQTTYHWIRSGENPDYELVHWLPAHLIQFAGVVAGSYTSLGVLPLVYGLRQLDVMNYYVGRLVAMSHSPAVTLLAGWHPWSFVRGLGFTLLLFEVSSLSLERFTGRTLATPRRRLFRWVLGLGLCLADGLLKFVIADWLRLVLNGTLPAE